MSTRFPDTKPCWLRLSDETWEELGRAYRAGATAKALSAQYNVRPGTIYRNAKKRGWQKHHNPASSVRALARADAPASPPEDAMHLYGPRVPKPPGFVYQSYPEPAPFFTPDPRYWLDRYTANERVDPGLTAQVAVTASYGALVAGNLADAAVLAQIGYLHARIAKLDPQSLRERVFEALTDERARNRLFSRDHRNGEEALKDAYDHWDRQRHDAERRAALKLAHAEARIGELEALLAAR